MERADTRHGATHASDQRKGIVSEDNTEIIQLIVFNLGDEEYGADINQVREIIRTGAITPIPDSPDFIRGMSNVRGEIPVVIDLKACFFLRADDGETAGKHMVMTEQQKNVFGLLVDEVTEVLRIPETQITPAPELIARIDREYVRGVITLEGRLIILLDLTKVLSGEQIAKLTEFSRRHHRASEGAEPEREPYPAEVSCDASSARQTRNVGKKAAKAHATQIEDTVGLSTIAE